LWLDTSGSDYSLKTWDGTAFRAIVVTSTMIKDGTIVNADIDASAAIAGTKVSPDFGSQTIATTGVISHALGAVGTPSLTFTGDLNTGFWSPAADTLAASTGGSEGLRITSGGDVNIGTGGGTISPNSSVTTGLGLSITDNGGILSKTTQDIGSVFFEQNIVSYTSGTAVYQRFRVGGTAIGSITTTNGTSTAYNTGSDYRLKENIAPISGGISRLLQLKPSRFNFKADPDTVVDGFLAHEAQAVVPECVTGLKDAVDEDGNPAYQGIDQSKLVPLLTAALQESIAKIEQLEQRLAAAGIA
jgi:hypothetical protein